MGLLLRRNLLIEGYCFVEEFKGLGVMNYDHV